MTLSIARTDEFKKLVRIKTSSTKRSTREDSSTKRDGSKGLEEEKDRKLGKQRRVDPWTKEANLVAHHIEELINFLSSIRRAYVDPSSSLTNVSTIREERNIDLSRGFRGFSSVKWFNEREKDQIDALVSIGLKKSIEGVRALEAAERSRQAQQINQSSNGLSRFFNLNINSEDQSCVQFNSHRASILWYLNQRLTELSKTIKDQQESRAKKKLDRTMKSGLSAMVNLQGSQSNPKSELTKLETKKDGLIPEIYRPKGYAYDEYNTHKDDYGQEGRIEEVLSDAQIQQFESESSTIQRLNEQTLSSIRRTESSLLEISNLQTELVNHLSQQTELIDQLWDDSIFSNSKIQQGNSQLFKAAEANKESRIMLLVFLFSASFALLFIDYMAP
ncbi:hypothetical protein PPACK8108_LOCUS1974 [Phakopsora pachyrhizi]|uniref:t-SNARE coiled-coil homology domain-containing protein n=1 Tax=Phakopsora pachyrhizi TaxID=170000 RepID=A0AAV0AGV1_PHAPC|nr:hypothetical protein PPACK8108_LOCUS1974 [Phakopsora pachyrhizi]